MEINKIETVICEYCKKEFDIHEYVGLEGFWYSGHICDEKLEAFKNGKVPE